MKEITILLNRANSIAGNVENLTVYLDGDDYSQNNSIRKDFYFPAFFWRKGDSVKFVPSKIAALMNDPNVTHFIWLSKSLLDGEDIHILWVYSHELRHFMQDYGTVDTIKIKSFLSELHNQEGFSGKGTQLEIPNELDAELFAKSTVKAVFGHTMLSDYISLKCKEQNGDSYFQRFEYLEKLLSVK
ncbi:MAG: hypothetical protein HRU78_02420 [Gammaproteobacteria bacterium]|nr:MAG: hypothetical protein HRU78_02420 [Gammaproteobacteria bacterium]